MRLVTKADAPIAPKLVICAGIGTIKQMLWDRSTAVVFAELATILYNRARLKTSDLRATETSQSLSSARAPLEECLGNFFFGRCSIFVRSLFDPYSIVVRSVFMNYPTWKNNLESSSLNSGQSEVDKRPLVLAVDDNHDNLELLTQILDLFGCECMGAVDGYAAISAAVDRPPDLIVLDICLPDIDGIEVVKRIQENAELRHIPIVAVTALAKAEDRERILKAGCVEYISKPFNIKDLETIVRQHLNSQMLLVEF